MRRFGAIFGGFLCLETEKTLAHQRLEVEEENPTKGFCKGTLKNLQEIASNREKAANVGLVDSDDEVFGLPPLIEAMGCHVA